MSRLLQAVGWGFEASLVHFHNGCKPLAVDSLYVYATAANGLIIIAQVSVHGISITGHWLSGVLPNSLLLVPHLGILHWSRDTSSYCLMH